MKTYKKVKKGITLVELIIVLALMSIVTMLVFNFVNLSQKKGSELDIKQELQHDGSMISESMMKNILHCKSIESVKGIEDTDPPIQDRDVNSIKSIKINFNGVGYLPSQPTVDNIDQIEYRLDIDAEKLKLIAWKRDNPLDPSDMNRTEVEVQTIAENVKGLKITNKDIMAELATKPLNHSDVEKVLQKQKGINLEITLEKKGIPHIHTCELNLRNSN